MNHKLKGRKLIHGDILSPEMEIAQFSSELTMQSIKQMVNNMNFGHEMIMIYKANRDNLHIANIVPMLEKMEEIYRQWDYEDYAAKRSQLDNFQKKNTDSPSP